MITRLVQLRIRKDSIDEALNKLREIAPHVRAMDGCHYLEINQALPPNDILIITYSRWENIQKLNAYRDTSLFKEFWKDLRQLFEEPARAWSFEQRVIKE